MHIVLLLSVHRETDHLTTTKNTFSSAHCTDLGPNTKQEPPLRFLTPNIFHQKVYMYINQFFFCYLCLTGMASHPPVSISEMADHIERLKANDNLKFSQEYEVGMLITGPWKSLTWGVHMVLMQPGSYLSLTHLSLFYFFRGRSDSFFVALSLRWSCLIYLHRNIYRR